MFPFNSKALILSLLLIFFFFSNVFIFCVLILTQDGDAFCSRLFAKQRLNSQRLGTIKQCKKKTHTLKQTIP